ncbi:MAG: putative lipoprotein YajG [Alphaproteobacteria bacterium]|jgi:uncharacterized lipoprotein YajG
MIFYKKILQTLCCVILLSGCYTDVQTPELSEMPTASKRPVDNKNMVINELEAAAIENEKRQQNLKKEK